MGVRFLLFLGIVCFAVADSQCGNFCATVSKEALAVKACNRGCELGGGRQFNIDADGVNSFCKNACEDNFSDMPSRALCYDGCTFVTPAPLMKPNNDQLPGSIFNDGLLQSILSFFNSQFSPENHGQISEPVIHKLRIRVLVPDAGEPNLLDGMHPTAPIAHPLMEEGHGRPLPRHNMMNEHSFRRALCHKMRVFAQDIAARPFFFVSFLFLIFNLVFLLTFVCLRCRARRARQAAFKRQMNRMPAFFEPPYVKINVSSPQPTKEEEAGELPEKVPIA